MIEDMYVDGLRCPIVDDEEQSSAMIEDDQRCLSMVGYFKQ